VEDGREKVSWLVVGAWCPGQQRGDAGRITAALGEFDISLCTFVDALNTAGSKSCAFGSSISLQTSDATVVAL